VPARVPIDVPPVEGNLGVGGRELPARRCGEDVRRNCFVSLRVSNDLRHVTAQLACAHGVMDLDNYRMCVGEPADGSGERGQATIVEVYPGRDLLPVRAARQHGDERGPEQDVARDSKVFGSPAEQLDLG